MSNETRLLALFQEANPVPDEHAMETDVKPAAYLATLEQRSSEMTQLDTRPKRTSEQRRGRLLLVAAAAAVVLGVAIVILTQANEERPVVTNPPVTTLVVPTTEPEVALDPLADFEVYTGRGSGTFTAPQSTVPFALTVSDGWIGHNDGTPARLTLCIPVPDQDFEACLIQGGLAEVAILQLDLGTIDETREYLASLDGAVLGSVEEVNVGGADGIRFEYQNQVPSWPSNVTQPPFPVVATTGCCKVGIGFGIYGKSVVTLVDVAGTTMTLVYQGESTDRGHPYLNGFEDHFDEGMAIIDSIVWGDLP